LQRAIGIFAIAIRQTSPERLAPAALLGSRNRGKIVALA
jgi:hypothetical protein